MASGVGFAGTLFHKNYEYGIGLARCTPENHVLYHISAPVPYMLRELCSTMSLALYVVVKKVLTTKSSVCSLKISMFYFIIEGTVLEVHQVHAHLRKYYLYKLWSFDCFRRKAVFPSPQTMWGVLTFFTPPPHKSTWYFRF